VPRQPSVALSAVVLGCPDPQALAGFYQRLLGWDVVRDQPGWVKLRSRLGGPGLAFQAEEGYVPPRWPAGPGDQQMMVHLDFGVDDLAAASAHALECGAVEAAHQPQDDVRVHLDPVGHPFCMFQVPA